ncbi:hypothetical protein [Nocardia sp. alder85J]|uniref:hypothetical protein n=1 Tax=Nocardia sp. alder85J TaxID=2862949 RepID=UPI001CD6717E|nr:hypothetical protein [Nocardia sp. alder85J]MCX4097115.1 hypothetical protein [Nocardia sp. alder85J]
MSARIEVRHSHLFPGLVLESDCTAEEFEIHFGDGGRTRAIVLHDPAGRAALAVDPYVTVAGTRIPARLWPIRTLCAEGGLRLRLGRALPAGPAAPNEDSP